MAATIQRKRRPTAPGVILRAHYLEPRAISITRFSGAADCSRKHMSNIVNGRARIEAPLAARMARVLGTTTWFWLNLRSAVDAYDAERELVAWSPGEVIAAP